MERGKSRDSFGQRQHISNERGTAPGDFGGVAEDSSRNRSNSGPQGSRVANRRLRGDGSPDVRDVQQVECSPADTAADRTSDQLQDRGRGKFEAHDVSENRNPSYDPTLNRVADGQSVLGE